MKKHWLFYLTGFFSGMSVMAIELGAQRLLSPYFSGSQVVWTIVIGVIMIAMALGNILGGKMADKYEKPDKLFILLLVAATWVMLIPLVGKYIIAAVAVVLATFVTWNYLVWASLVSCLIVFVFPLLVLGMVTPNIVKYATRNLSDNGKIVGRVEAFNTIGSIIGTFIPTFVSIPFIGTSLTFIVFASILYAICLAYFIFRKKFIVRSVIMVVFALGIGIFGSTIKVKFFDNSNTIYEGESMYNYLRVEEDEDTIVFSTNVLFGVQSIKMKNNKLTGMYYDYALSSLVMNKNYNNHQDVLVLGLGTGTFAYEALNYFPDLKIDGVEIDSKVIDLAHKYFSLPEEVNTYAEDGRAFINLSKDKYDVIMVDAYRDISVPFQMASLEFFTLVKDHLNDGGVMVLNLNMFDESEGSINDYIIGTIKRLFNHVYALNVGTNLEIFATMEDITLDFDSKINTITQSDLKAILNFTSQRMYECEGNNYLLTDDKAPVEMLGARALDSMIREELEYLRESIKGMTLKEIIEMYL